MTFNEQALAAAAERGGNYKCRSRGAMALFLVFEIVKGGGETWEFDYCPACVSNPSRKRWLPQQLKLEV